MKNRILSGWNIRRILFFGMGLLIVVQAILLTEWIFGLIGFYWLVMGLLGIGCASGSCAVTYQHKSPENKNKE
jgi:hypothetical protein